MKLGTLLLVGMSAAAFAACSRGRAGGGSSSFDRRWEALALQGAQAIRVTDDRGAALMDDVLGAQAGAVAAAVPATAESYKGAAHAGPLPDRPDASEVQRLVRQYVPGVKACYQRLTRAGDARAGKAIVSFEIATSGHVEALSVDAPAFDGSSLAGCIDGQVSRWLFPPSRKGAPATSYPFVFG